MEPNDSWISIDGTVQEVWPDAFTLHYGEGVITVEMDDGDRDADGYQLAPGNLVTVTGKVDADLFENTTIEAGSVFVESLGTYFYASSADEEDTFVTIRSPLEVSKTVLQGPVTEIGEHEFIIDTGMHEVTVETSTMAYDPLDDIGYQKVEEGDYVSVTGEVDYDFFDGRHLNAERITTLHEG